MKKLVYLVTVLFASVYSNAQNVNITLADQLTFGSQTCANICGYADNSGNEYALVGTSGGMTIVDVTTPTNSFTVTQIPWPAGSNQLWKEIKVWGNYAYTVSEAGSGVQITNLTNLPGTSLPYQHWTPTVGTCTLDNVHALHIANTGYMYLYGSNCTSNGGAIIACDLNVDPYNPTVAGAYNGPYIHDGYVRNDTVYGGEIYNGLCKIIDFTNKTSPVVLASIPTPTAFTHNTWLSGDGKTVYTTDENSSSWLAAYDISNLSNITEVDRIRSNPQSNSIVHNTHVTSNDFIVTSWYKDGLTIVDGARPHNLIQVGNYDTYPAGSGSGFDGCWGVYPFLPSGTIVASNIDEGLFVLSPTYVRACYLEGNVKDSITLANISGAKAVILTKDSTTSSLIGDYATGTVTPGTYSVKFSKTGYITKIVNNVTLTNGVLTTLNVKLLSIAVGINQLDNPTTFMQVMGNPFHGNTTINYYLGNDEDENNNMIIFDNLGKVVLDKKLMDREGEVTFGNDVAPGVYYISINNGKPSKIVKAD